jgi:hypothetical protein
MKRPNTDNASAAPSKRRQRPSPEASAPEVPAENSDSSTSDTGVLVEDHDATLYGHLVSNSEAAKDWKTVSDHDKGYLYVLFAKSDRRDGSQLFSMSTSTMNWEQILVRSLTILNAALLMLVIEDTTSSH